MQSTLGFAPTPEDLADEHLLDTPVITMRFPQPGRPADDDPESGDP